MPQRTQRLQHNGPDVVIVEPLLLRPINCKQHLRSRGGSVLARLQGGDIGEDAHVVLMVAGVQLRGRSSKGDMRARARVQMIASVGKDAPPAAPAPCPRGTP